MDPRPSGVTQPSTYMPIALKAMDLAAELVRARLPSVVNAKGDRDMVSDIDVEIERELRGYLRTQTPEVGFPRRRGRKRARRRRDSVVLDPIDGTANFVKGIPLFAISLALIDDKEPVLGVIDVPAERRRYSAVAGLGAYCGDTRIRVRPTNRIEDAVVTIGDYAVGEEAEQENQVRLTATGRLAPRVQRVRMLGSAAIDLAWLAHGRTDGAVIFGHKPWDTAAGVILVREADGVVVDAGGNHHDVWSASMVAASGELLDTLLGLVTPFV